MRSESSNTTSHQNRMKHLESLSFPWMCDGSEGNRVSSVTYGLKAKWQNNDKKHLKEWALIRCRK